MARSRSLLIPLILTLSACAGQERSQDSNTAVAADVDAWSGTMPYVQPWLRQQLPPGLLSYQRIPNPIAALTMPKGNMFDAALGSDANIRNLLSIRDGLSAQAADPSSLFATPAFQLIARDLVSPIELAVIGLPQVSALVGMTMSYRSHAEVEALFAALSTTLPVPALTGPLDAQGFGQLAAPIPVLVHFDSASGRLALYGGPMATRTAFVALLDPPAPERAAADQPHPMAALEAQIDQSGQGYFGWVDASQALGLGSMFMPPETMSMLRVSGLDQLRAIGFGAGVADGKGRLKFVADIGTNRASRLLPIIENRISARSVGDPRGLFILSLPGPDEFARLQNVAFAFFPPEVREQWDGLLADFANAAGAGIDEILRAVGPELITITDRAGSYSGLRIRDPELLNDVLDRLAASAGIAIGERRAGRQTIRHVSLPGTLSLPASAGLPPQAQALLTTIGRMRTRFYWVEDGDYLYVAGLPQLLIDRANLRPDTNLAEWLAETQRTDLSSTLLGATGSVANLPRTMYQVYLSLMQGIADMTAAEIDIWSMPTATQLGLPERGTLGFSVNLGEPYLSLELAFESHPAEVLLAGGPGVAVAVAGIMAAVALPAYQDFAQRAQVAEQR